MPIRGKRLIKKPLFLRSCEALNIQVKRILSLFGENDIKKIECSVGAEQEYFLIDHEKYMQRLDLRLTGRTL